LHCRRGKQVHEEKTSWAEAINHHANSGNKNIVNEAEIQQFT